MYTKFSALLCRDTPCNPIRYLIMIKLIALFMTTGLLQLAATTYAQQVTLQVKEAHIQEVLLKLTKQTGYNFIAKSNVLEVIGRVSIDVTNQPLKDVLHRCFSDRRFEFLFQSDNTVVIKKRPNENREVTLQQRVITGRVSDENDLPLSGATVSVKNTQVATTTDVNGH